MVTSELSAEISAFKDYLNLRGLGKRSIITYSSVIVTMIRNLKGEPVTLEAALRFSSARKRIYVRQALIYYSSFKGWGWDIPKVKETAPKPHDVPNFNEFQIVISSLPREERLIALFLMGSGCRISEALTLKPSNMRPDGTVVMETKGRKYRTVIMPDAFLAELQDYIRNVRGLGSNEYVFYPDNHAEIKARIRIFWFKLNSVSKDKVGKAIAPHDFRRYAASWLYKETHDIQLVQRWLGHADISTTQRYLSAAMNEETIKRAKDISSGLINSIQ